MSPAQQGARPGAAPRSRPRPLTFLTLMVAMLAAVGTLTLLAAGRAAAESRPSQTLYTPPSDALSPGTFYPRMRLRYNGSANGTLLATFEQ